MITAGPSRRRRGRRYAFIAGMLVACTVIIGVAGGPGVHVAKAEITFAPPASVEQTTQYQGYVETMIAFAGTVSAAYNQRYPSTKLSSPQATLFGNGLREGISVHASTTGNQWRVGLDRPVIVVTVSAPTEKDALATLHQSIARLTDITVQLQDDADVDQSMRIRTFWHEQEVRIDSFGRTPGSTAKGSVVLVVVALLVSASVTAALERRATDGPRSDRLRSRTAEHNSLRAQVRR